MSRTARHRRPDRRGVSFTLLVAVPFCIAIALQGIICFGVLSNSGTTVTMKADAYDLFSERISSHAGYLENDMVFRWSELDSLAQAVEGDIDDVLGSLDATADDLTPGSEASIAVLDATAKRLVFFTRRAEVDGLYLVLAGADAAASEEDSVHAALYIRDSNPKADLENGADLMLAVCPISVSKKLDIALDSSWSATYPLAPEGDARSAFYYRPMQAAAEHPTADMEDLGYWGRPVDLGWAGTSSITYSMPIQDGDGTVVGVLGVEVRLDRVTDFMPYRELDDEGTGSYILAVTNEDGGYERDAGVMPVEGSTRTYEVLATTGASQSLYVEDGDIAAVLDGRAYPLVRPVSEEAGGKEAVVAMSEITLYDSTSPFASEHWTLMGLESQDALFSSSTALERNLLGVFGASLLVGIVIAGLVAWISSSRLRHLMGEVRSARPEQPIEFASTGIVEIDELSDAIQTLGTEVAYSASRLSQILELSDRTIGAFEYNAETDAVTCTDGFFTTLSLLKHPDPRMESLLDGMTGTVIRHGEFSRLLGAFWENAEEEAPWRYLLSDPGQTCWVRLVIMENKEQNRVFGLVEDVTHEIETRRRIEHERDHDILTGLLNRRAFECEVTQRLEDDPPPIAAMMMLDLDNLKYINDTYGHDWGDHYIKAAGRAVSLTFQGSGLFARISGDEFLMFVDRCPDRASIDALFDAFRHSLETSELEAPDGRTLKVRASMGVAYYPQDAGDFARLREYADFAMYMAKSSRKGELFTFEDESYREKSFILNNKEELNRLLEESLISYHFQPIVDARAGEVAAYEALMRPQIESIPTPDRVLALARSQSKLYRVEHVTFFGALETYARFPQSDGITLFVNSIATQRLSADDELALQERYGDLLKRVVIEITESEYSREMALYKEALAHRFGARLAIDDFGSGYNGETSLLDYRADFVKIDMGIVRDIDTVKDHQDIAKSLISYAHDRGISVVAEGIETEAELRSIIKLGTDYLQGYLLGRPQAAPQDVPGDIKRLIRSIAEGRRS